VQDVGCGSVGARIEFRKNKIKWRLLGVTDIKFGVEGGKGIH
jgi:hypothetical protein